MLLKFCAPFAFLACSETIMLLFHKQSVLCHVFQLSIQILTDEAPSFSVESAGLNTGVQDAHNLAWKLAAVLKGHASETLLSTYEMERQPVILNIAKMIRLFELFMYCCYSLGLANKYALVSTK